MTTITKKRSSRASNTHVKEDPKTSVQTFPSLESLIWAKGILTNSRNSTPVSQLLHVAQAAGHLGLPNCKHLATEVIRYCLTGTQFGWASKEAAGCQYQMEKLRRGLADMRYTLQDRLNQDGQNVHGNNLAWAQHDLLLMACLLCSRLYYASYSQTTIAGSFADDTSAALARTIHHISALI